MDGKIIVNFLVEDNIFNFNPSYGTKNTKFIDLFYTGLAEIVSDIPINKYLQTTYDN